MENDNKFRFVTPIVWFIGPILFGIVSLVLGQSNDFDLRNYHYYNPYAYLNSRISYDFAPAQAQSYLNPLLDIPFFLLTNLMPAWIVGFIYGAIAGLNFPLLFILSRRILNNLGLKGKIFYPLFISLTGCLGPAFLFEVGLTFQDNVVSLLALTGLIFLVSIPSLINSGLIKKGIINTVLASLLFGLAAGLKLTTGLFFISAILAVVLTLNNWHKKIQVFTIYCTTGILAILLVSGQWMWTLWTNYTNPLFPFYNNIFQSPILKTIGTYDERFLPKSLSEIVFWPIIFSFNLERVWEFPGKDFRFLLVYFMLLWLLTQYIYIKFFKPITNNQVYRNILDNSSVLIIFFVISFIIWTLIFSTYRYILVLELITPLVLVTLVYKIPAGNKVKVAIIAICFAIMILFIRDPSYWIRNEWTNNYIETKTPELINPDHALVLMLGTDALSYVISSFPPKVRFIREEGNLQFILHPDFIVKLRDMVKSHKGDLYVLFPEDDSAVNVHKTSADYSLEINLDKCQPVESNLKDRLKFCLTRRK